MTYASRPTEECDPTELSIRRDLSACYRLAAHFGWDDLLATHFSARVPGPTPAFLLNPLGLMFEEITASSLIKIDLEGNILEPTEYEMNRAGFVIHSAVYQARPDASSVMHLHSRDGVAVSATEAGILPLNQTAMIIHDDIAFHEYEGVAFDLDERARLQTNLGSHNLMLLRNHGTLTVGESVGSAFYRMYLLEWASTVQVRTLAMNTALHAAPQAAIDKVGRQVNLASIERMSKDLLWPALMRKARRMFSNFAD